MSFLQPWLLAALPLVALPVIIHLINQRRFQTIRWAAMMFLLTANRMSRGYAKIRQWLILALRVAAIGALIFAVSRPLAGGWLGLAGGGRADTTIILFDRSPSMEQSAGGGLSKRELALQQLVPALETLGSSHWVLIESGSNQARELETVEALLNAPETGPSSASADLPAMLQAAHDYIRTSKAGRTEIWICSDIRRNDWNAESGRWQALREGFLEFPQGVRFHLLAYPELAQENLAIRVTEVRHRVTSDGGELLISLQIDREGEGEDEARQSIPLRFEIDGSRSEVPVDLTGSRTVVKDHRIPLAAGQNRGWGKVSIPADANPSDNESWFVFDEPAPRHALVVADDPMAVRPLRLAASVAPSPDLNCSSELASADQLAAIDWENLSLLLWQGPLPEGKASQQVRSFLDRGGFVIFFPPRESGNAAFAGVRWTSWNEGQLETSVESWRGDEGLLAHGQSGVPLPLGELKVQRWCGLSGAFTPLATLQDGSPLLARVATDHGGLFFCATTPALSDSSMATDGVAFYILIQRALAGGSEALENTRQLIAGCSVANRDATSWTRLAGAEGAISTDYPSHNGVYEAGPRLLAVNRDPSESPSLALTDQQVASLFQGLDFSRVDHRNGGAGSLIQEIWRLFLVALMVVMVAEAALCLPKRSRSRNASATGAFP